MFKKLLTLVLVVLACQWAGPLMAQSRLFYAVDQGQSRVIRAEAGKANVAWEWRVDQHVPDSARKWFSNLSEVKPVYNQQYLLVTASGGGVALVRLSDKKVVFLVYVGGNTHSAEVLPDGNIVAASSTGGYLTLIRTDTTVAPSAVKTSRIKMPDAHNVVWDRKRSLLWATGGQVLYGLSYNMHCNDPALTIKDQINLPESGSHDLFPAYGEDQLWLSTHHHTWAIDMATKKITETGQLDRIKSISSGPAGYPLLMLRAIDTGRQWYNHQLISTADQVVFSLEGLKMYKARWAVANTYSYPDTHTFKTCK